MLAVIALLRPFFTLDNIGQETAGPNLSKGENKEEQASPLSLSLHITNASLWSHPLIQFCPQCWHGPSQESHRRP